MDLVYLELSCILINHVHTWGSASVGFACSAPSPWSSPAQSKDLQVQPRSSSGPRIEAVGFFVPDGGRRSGRRLFPWEVQQELRDRPSGLAAQGWSQVVPSGRSNRLRMGAVLGQREFAIKLTPQCDSSDLVSFDKPVWSFSRASYPPAGVLGGPTKSQAAGRVSFIYALRERGLPWVGTGPGCNWVSPYIRKLGTCLATSLLLPQAHGFPVPTPCALRVVLLSERGDVFGSSDWLWRARPARVFIVGSQASCSW